MGFYGNITDTHHTHFQFDKIYENRRAMEWDLYSGRDNVFTGRFVLIKYDPSGNFFAGDMLVGYKFLNDEKIYLDIEGKNPYLYTSFKKVSIPSVEQCDEYYVYDGIRYYKLPNSSFFSQNQEYYTALNNSSDAVGIHTIVRLLDNEGQPLNSYYECIGADATGIAKWQEILVNQNYNDYFANYNIDASFFKDKFDIRGYDATVWEKVYSEGQGKFILVAHLNGMMPALELFAEPPSEFPSSPYIDAKSTDALYRFHFPSHWGFRIKEAPAVTDEETGITTYPKSDQKVSQAYNTYNAYNQITNTENKEINAEIYFNKKANNRLFNYNDRDTADKINITPTGESGKTYYDKDGRVVKKDTYELAIHLPMIGNMVADGYNLIYDCPSEPNDDGLYMRYTDVNWYPGDSSEELKYNGNSSIGGKTHNLNTIAGSLNTIHDIMGQIVIPLQAWPNEEQINSLSPEYLYTYEGVYYRRGYINTKTIIPDSAYSYTQQFNITQDKFTGNKYYYKEGQQYVEAKIYNPSLSADGYYLRNINSVRYTPITLIPFESGKYYLREGENYRCDNALYYPTYVDRTYYTVTPDEGRFFTGQYMSDGSFYTEENGNYLPSFTTAPSVNTNYYTITATSRGRARFYRPGSYYRKEGNMFELAMEPTYDPSKTYYVLIFNDVPKYGYNSDGEVIQYYEVIDYEEDILFTNPTGYSLNDLYVIENGAFIPYENIQNLVPLTNRNPYTIVREYYTINVTTYESGTLYLPGAYYIKTDDNSYMKSYEDLDRTRKYYLIINTEMLEHPFYIPNRYYWEPSQDDFVLSQSDTMTLDRQYYKKSAMYVDNDETGQCPHGYEWNDYSAYIPPSVSLFTAEKKPGLIRLSELGKDTNSLYGLLLQLNKLYAPGEDEIRDIDTVRGAYNTLRDMLYQVKTLRPGYILQVNDFGQIESISLEDLKDKLNNV